MYRGPPRGPCIGSIYTHSSRVGGIEQLFPSLDREEDVGINVAVRPEGEDAAAMDAGKMPRPSREAVVAMQRQPLPPVATMAA